METIGGLPDIQLALRPGCIDFAWGHPHSALLPVADLRRAATVALGRDGTLALAYGAPQGPGRLIELLCARLSHLDREALAGHPVPGQPATGQPVPGYLPAPEDVFITGGVSQGLDLVCALCTEPGDVALVQSPVYHLALRILRDHGLDLVPVACDDEGLDLAALEDTLARLRRAGRRIGLLYTVPTFSNPTGRSFTAERRAALVQLAARHDLLVVEDDVYRELWFEAPPPPPLASYDPVHVIRLGAFSKILAPGLRLGWMVAGAALVQRAVGYGMLDSGGGVNHLTAHVVAEYMRDGRLDDHVAMLRTAYRDRRDALLDALARHLPVGCHVEPPGGGFFLWLRAPQGVDATALLSRAEAGGVSYVPGALFHTDGGGRRHLRLAFSLLSPAEMEQGAQCLARVLRAAG